MDDKKTKTDPKESKPIDLVKQAQADKADFGANQSDDINKNLGHFTKTVKEADTSATEQIKLDFDSKVIDKASKEQVDFERFNKTKRGEAKTKTKFGERVNLLLRSNKGIKVTWIIELTLMIIVIVLAAIAIWFVGSKIYHIDAKTDSPWREGGLLARARAGNILLWISMFPCFIPLIYLVTTWFIGINQVARSKIFHYMFWICLIVSLLCFFVGIGLSIDPMIAIFQWGAYWQ